MFRWFTCKHDWSIVYHTTRMENKKVNGGSVHLSSETTVRECSKCGKKKKDT